MICPKCNMEMVRVGDFDVCGKCGIVIPVKQNIDSSENFQGLIHFRRLDEIKELADEIIKRYPSVISRSVGDLFNTNTYVGKCSCLKNIYYNTTRLVALICMNYYLRDENAKPDRKIQKFLAEISMPVDSTWKNIIESVNDYYKSDDDARFFITEFSRSIDYLFNINNGYEKAITGTIRQPDYSRLSIMQAGIQLRNAIHHDPNVLKEEDYKGIYPYYLDIVFSILRSLKFLNGERYMLLIDKDNRMFEKLHGIENSIIEISDANFDNSCCEGDIYLYDSRQNYFYPVYPFAIRFQDFWDEEKEFIFDHIYKRNAFYFGREKGRREDSRDGYIKIKDLISRKNVEISYDLNRMNYYMFKECAIDSSYETLLSGYIGKKYFSECYVSRQDMEPIISRFMDSSKTALFITGNTGMGKSALLCNLAYKYLKDEGSNVVPIFINGRDLRKSGDGGTNNLLLQLIRKFFFISSSVEYLEVFFDKVNDMINQERGLRNSVKVLLIIDALNEGCSVSQAFGEIDDFISKTYDYERNKNKYPWLKIIYSMRSTGLNELEYQKRRNQLVSGEDQIVLKNPDLYYKVCGDEAGGNETPIVELKCLTETEIYQAFSKYSQNSGLYPILSKKNIPYKMIAGKTYAFGNPLFLRMYLNILEKNNGNDVDIGKNGEMIIKEYYNLLTDNRWEEGKEIKHLLNSICSIMIEKCRGAMVPMDEISGIVNSYREYAAQRKIPFYNDPLENLISEGLLDRKRLYAKAGEPVYECIVFTQQKFNEYSMVRYLIEAYGEPSGEMLGKIMNKRADFDEYNTAIAVIMNSLWKENKVGEIARVETLNADRYRKVFEMAVFSDMEDAVNRRASYEEQVRITKKSKYNFRILTSDTDNLKYVKEIYRVFLFGAIDRFYDKVCGGLFFELSLEVSRQIYETLGIENLDYNLCLNYLGEVYKEKGDLDRAYKCYKKEMESVNKLAKSNPDSEELMKSLADLHKNTGIIYEDKGDLNTAHDEYQKSLEIICNFLKCNPGSEDVKYSLSSVYSRLRNVYQKKGDLEAALEYCMRDLELSSQLVESNPSSERLKYGLSYTYSSLGDIYQDKGRLLDSQRCYEKYMEILQDLVQSNPDSESYKDGLAIAYSRIGDIFKLKGDINMACNYFEKEMEISKELVSLNPDNERLKYNLSAAYSELGNIYKDKGNLDKAFELYNEDFRISQELLGANPESEDLKYGMAVSYEKIGDIYKSKGLFEEALEHFEKSLSMMKELSSANPGNINFQFEVAGFSFRTGEVYESQGKTEDTLHYYRDADEILDNICDSIPESYSISIDIIKLYCKLGRIYGKDSYYIKAENIADKLEEEGVLLPGDRQWIQKCRMGF